MPVQQSSTRYEEVAENEPDYRDVERRLTRTRPPMEDAVIVCDTGAKTNEVQCVRTAEFPAVLGVSEGATPGLKLIFDRGEGVSCQWRTEGAQVSAVGPEGLC